MKKALSILIILAALKISAQQEAHYTQYMYNTLAVNPGYAGSRGAITLGVLGRTQWVGVEGAPKTQTFFIHSPVLNEKVGLGLAVVNDKIGPINQMLLNGSFAYHVKLDSKRKLAMGLNCGMNLFQPKLAGLATTSSNDPSFVNTNVQNTIAPTIGSGLYYYSELFYLGLSSPNLLQNKIKTNTNSLGQTYVLQQRHFYAIVGTVFKVNEIVKLKPTAMVKIVKNSPASIDLTLEALIYDKFTMGLAHRWKESISGLIGYCVNPQLRIGFAYDYTTSALQKYNSGSYEIMIQYDAIFKRDKVKSPRYF